MLVRMLALLAACLVLGGGASAQAQALSERAIQRCIRATVRVQVDVPPGPTARGGSSTGSGVLIDPRGYVLTNLHVVGRTRPGQGGLPGSFFGDGQRVQIATVDDARTTTQPRWLARVVRADVGLDLALLRIVSTIDGAPLPRGTTFSTVEIAPTSSLVPGAPVWAFGFPLNLRTINVTGGHATGFQMNTSGDVAWIRTDADFNPGNSGGLLADQRGRLVGVPTAVVRAREMLASIELARPAERIPPAWLEALGRGHLDDVIVTGIGQLAEGAPLRVEARGDAGGLDDDAEIQLLSLPATRPAVIEASPRVPLALVSERGILVEGRGALLVPERAPSDLLLAVLLPAFRDGRASSADVTFSPRDGQRRAPTLGALAPGAGAGAGQVVGSGNSVIGPAPPSRAPSAGAPSEAIPPPPQVPSPDGARGATTGILAQGSVLEAGSGRPVSAWVLVARPGVDAQRVATLMQAGMLRDQDLDTVLLTRAQSSAQGDFELGGLVPGVLPTLVVADGYRPTLVYITIPTGVPAVTLSPLRLFR